MHLKSITQFRHQTYAGQVHPHIHACEECGGLLFIFLFDLQQCVISGQGQELFRMISVVRQDDNTWLLNFKYLAVKFQSGALIV